MLVLGERTFLGFALVAAAAVPQFQSGAFDVIHVVVDGVRYLCGALVGMWDVVELGRRHFDAENSERHGWRRPMSRTSLAGVVGLGMTRAAVAQVRVRSDGGVQKRGQSDQQQQCFCSLHELVRWVVRSVRRLQMAWARRMSSSKNARPVEPTCPQQFVQKSEWGCTMVVSLG